MHDAIAAWFQKHIDAAQKVVDGLKAERDEALATPVALEKLVKGRALDWYTKTEKAEAEALEAAIAATPDSDELPEIKTKIPEVSGASVAKAPWKIEIVDVDKLPRKYLKVDMTELRKAVNQLGERAPKIIPGIKVERPKSLRIGEA